MSARKTKGRNSKRTESRPIDAGESRSAVALTVVWMLTLMSTTVALVMTAIAWLVVLAFPVAAGRAHPLGFLPGLLVFVAATTGSLCLLLALLVHRVRQIPPPLAITVAAALIGVAPLVTIAILAFLG
ncbi:MAG TPA: hypothetical protein VFV87_18040 [Pirellulaceae bacterium]|nr:hypothetical protein [Pirellulaceae bacterium]